MKYVALLFTIIITTSFNGNSQHFTLQDSTFKVGDCLIDYTIVFNYSSSKALYEGQLFLDSLLIFLHKNPQLVMEIGVHSDERGDAQSSRSLTQYRAKFIAEILIKQGIQTERIRARGYESDKPVIRGAKTEEEHRMNRRVEITILGTTYFKE